MPMRTEIAFEQVFITLSCEYNTEKPAAVLLRKPSEFLPGEQYERSHPVGEFVDEWSGLAERGHASIYGSATVMELPLSSDNTH